MENDFVKIINTTYKLLDFFPDGEPLKNKAKETVLAVLESLTLTSGARGWVSLQKEKAAAKLLDDIEILESYLKLGKYQGWIDNVNFLILVKEYDNIKSQVAPPKGKIRQSLEIISGVDSSTMRGTRSMEPENNPLTPREKELAVSSSESKLAAPPKAENKLPQDDNYSERQKKILQILAGKEKVQVSDIIKEIPNITKRTIRRDLDDLLKRGKVIRNGEWNQVVYKINMVK